MKILITPLYGLGDIIMTFPAIEVLKKSRPDWQVDYFTFNKTAEKILKLNPYIDNIIYEPILDYPKLKSVYTVLKKIFKKYDITINFYPSNRKDYNIFSFLTFSKVRIGHTYLNSNFSQLNFLKNLTIKEKEDLHCIEENIKLLELLDVKTDWIPKLSIYLPEKFKDKAKSYIKHEDRIKIGIHPGSSKFKNHSYKRWKPEKFIKVIEYFKDYDFYIFGTKEEEEVVNFIVSKTENSIPIFNLDIIDVASVISNMNLFISNDSGIMHLANALGIPVVAIFGPTNPVWVRPWNEPYRVVRLNLNCSPCFYYSPKPLECKIEDKYKCLNDLDEKLVIDAVKELIRDVS
ncbi:MAG: glycosyltransferase family 9 protein [Hydrogenothermaceae bacterium]